MFRQISIKAIIKTTTILATAILLASSLAVVGYQTKYQSESASWRASAAESTESAESTPPTIQDFGKLIGVVDDKSGNSIIDLLTRVAWVLAVIAIIYAGILYFTAFGNEEKPTRAKQIIMITIVGLIIIIFARVIIRSPSDIVPKEENAGAAGALQQPKPTEPKPTEPVINSETKWKISDYGNIEAGAIHRAR